MPEVWPTLACCRLSAGCADDLQQRPVPSDDLIHSSSCRRCWWRGNRAPSTTVANIAATVNKGLLRIMKQHHRSHSSPTNRTKLLDIEGLSTQPLRAGRPKQPSAFALHSFLACWGERRERSGKTSALRGRHQVLPAGPLHHLGGRDLTHQPGEEPLTSPVGIILALLSLLVMTALAFAKQRVGREMGSRALVADSKETWVCSYLSLTLLLGVGAYAVFGWWWG
jgi:hypothetical protein